MKLWAKTVLAIIAGIFVGSIFGERATILQPVGTLFLSALNMLIVPLVFSSMVTGIAEMPDKQKLGRIGGKTLLLYLVTSLIAIAFGCLMYFIPLGEQLRLITTAPIEASDALPSLTDVATSLVPRNIVRAFADGNVVHIILFAAFFGFCLNRIGPKGKPIVELVRSLSQVMFRMTSVVMACSPLGVFALIACSVGTFGHEILGPVCTFLVAYYVACLAFVLVVFCGLIWRSRLRALPFFRAMTSVFATAASTCSSSATLPASIECATERLGISRNLADFVIPLGCSLNMNGSALFQVMSTFFIAQAYGMELHWQHVLVISFTVLMSTLGTASIPGGGFLMLSIVFSAVGIPLEGLAILAGIDRLRDMATTTLNISGDVVCALYVAKDEGELDESVYYQREVPAASLHKALERGTM